jgi:hypothetical protein
MTPLQFQAGDLHLAGVNDNRILRQKAGFHLAETYATYMNQGGVDLIFCFDEADYSFENIHLVVHDDVSMSDDSFVGSFVIYGCKTLSEDSGTVTFSAMAAPSLDGYPSDSWVSDALEIMGHFLTNEVACKDGTVLDLTEWRFPVSSDGSPSQNLWFDAPGMDVGHREEFARVASDLNLALTTDEDLLPVMLRAL